MTEQKPFKWCHFQSEIILLCVRRLDGWNEGFKMAQKTLTLQAKLRLFVENDIHLRCVSLLL
jgi:hypothetical protein